MKTYLFKIIVMFCAILVELSLISCGCEDSGVFEKKIIDWLEQDKTGKPANIIPQLMFSKIVYEQDGNRVVYAIRNISSVAAQGVELSYTNISADAAGKAVLLNGKHSGTVSLGNIASGDVSLDASLAIDFKSSQKAKFKFEILYQGKPIGNATREEEFKVLPPTLRLVSISSEKLFGLNSQFVFKIEKLLGIGLVDISKLKVIIKRGSPNKGKIYYKGKEIMEEIVGADLGPIGDNIALVIKYDIAESIEYETFTINLIYDGSKMHSRSLPWNLYDNSAYAALSEAVSSNDLNKVKELLKNSASININTKYILEREETLLHKAVAKSNKEIIQTLLDHGANANVQDYKLETSLHIAVKRGDLVIILLLLGVPGIDLDIKNTFYDTPLELAVEAENKDIIQLLLDKGADVNIRDQSGQTLLHKAAEKGNLLITSVLLKAPNIDVNAKDSIGQVPLHLAVEKGDQSITSVLLEAPNIDVNAKDKSNNVPLHKAVEKENLPIVQLLLQAKGIKLDVYRNILNPSPIEIALKKKNLAIVQALLAKGVNVNITGILGKSLLHLAVLWGDSDIVKALLDVPNINIDAQDTSLETSLHSAISAKNPIMVKLLLDYNARQDIPNNKGKTPLDLAQTTDNVEIKKLFGLTAS